MNTMDRLDLLKDFTHKVGMLFLEANNYKEKFRFRYVFYDTALFH